MQKARRIRDLQVLEGKKLVELSCTQLQGMADEVSCDLL